MMSQKSAFMAKVELLKGVVEKGFVLNQERAAFDIVLNAAAAGLVPSHHTESAFEKMQPQNPSAAWSALLGCVDEQFTLAQMTDFVKREFRVVDRWGTFEEPPYTLYGRVEVVFDEVEFYAEFSGKNADEIWEKVRKYDVVYASTMELSVTDGYQRRGEWFADSPEYINPETAAYFSRDTLLEYIRDMPEDKFQHAEGTNEKTQRHHATTTRDTSILKHLCRSRYQSVRDAVKKTLLTIGTASKGY